MADSHNASHCRRCRPRDGGHARPSLLSSTMRLFAALMILAAAAAVAAPAPAAADQTFTWVLGFPTTDCSGPPNSNVTFSAADGSCVLSPFTNSPNSPFAAYAAATAKCAGGVGSALTGKLFTDKSCATAAAATFNDSMCVLGDQTTNYKSVRVVCGGPIKKAMLIRQFTDIGCAGTLKSADIQYPLDVCYASIYRFSALNATHVGIFSYNNGVPSVAECPGAAALVGNYLLDTCTASPSGSYKNTMLNFPSANGSTPTPSPSGAGVVGPIAKGWAVVTALAALVVVVGV